MDSLDLFQLFNIVKQEERVSTGFFNIGVRRDYLSILSHISFSEDKKKYAVDYRNAHPIYLNNLDTDTRYKRWRNSVKLLLEPYYPGMIRPIARNLFTLIFVLDPAGKEDRRLMELACSLFEHEVPLRIGILFALESNGTVSGMDDGGVGILNLLNFLAVNNTYHDALRKIVEVIEPYRTHDTIDPFYIKNWFEANYGDVDYQDVFGPHSPYDEGRTNGRDFLEQSALGDAPKVLLNGFVLDDSGIIAEKFEETLMLEVMRITHELQEAVMQGKLHDRLNVENWIMEQKDVVPRYNKNILRTISQKNILDFTNVFECEIGSLSDFIRLEESEKTQCITKRMTYIRKTDVDNTMPLTLWIAVDLDTVHGRQMVYNALKFLKRSKKTRVGYK
nr:Protein UGGT-2 [Haemonchus contortus]